MNKKPTEEKDETEDKDEVKFDTLFTRLPFLDQIHVLKTCAHSADPVKTPQNAASYPGFHCLLTRYVTKWSQSENINWNTFNLKTKFGLIKTIRMDKPIGRKRVDT